MVDKGAQAKWDHWAREHPDLLLSVERGPDLDQTKLIAQDVAAKLELGPEDDLLDVGCGSGLLLSILRERCRSVFGVDFAASQLALGRKHFPDIPFASAAVAASNLRLWGTATTGGAGGRGGGAHGTHSTVSEGGDTVPVRPSEAVDSVPSGPGTAPSEGRSGVSRPVSDSCRRPW